MKYFIDCEFIDKPFNLQLISIGIVCEDGREYYAVSSEYNYYDADEWVKENVIKPIYADYMKTATKEDISWYADITFFQRPDNNASKMSYACAKNFYQIQREILDFIGDDIPEFYGYYSSYDWVLFCGIFGRMLDLPKNWPMFINDLKVIQKLIGVSNFTANDIHNALDDARWMFEFYKYLNKRIKHE